MFIKQVFLRNLVKINHLKKIALPFKTILYFVNILLGPKAPLGIAMVSVSVRPSPKSFKGLTITIAGTCRM